MRARSIGSVAVLAAVATATMATGAGSARLAAHQARGSHSLTVKIALPAPGSVQVSSITIRAKAPKGKRVGALKVTAKNASDLGTPQTNTQAVAVISPKVSKKSRATFKVWLFVHRFASAGRRRSASTAEVDNIVLALGGGRSDVETLGAVIVSENCGELSGETGSSPSTGVEYYNFLTDDWLDAAVRNLVPAFDTQAEEQVDNAVFQKPCKDAENPADDPPPV